jgi:hypothetical protein
MEDAAEGDYEQWYPSVAHNSVKNEFLVAWFDENPKLQEGGIVGKFFNNDGTPKGEPFVIVDAPGSQGNVVLTYVPKLSRYFVVWQDSKNFVPKPEDPSWYRENDIFCKWLDEDGKQVGYELPVYEGEGDQTLPQVAYSPVTDKFLITWWDTHAPNDYKALPGEFGGNYGEISSVLMGNLNNMDVRGAIYGIPSFLTVRAVEQGTGTPVEGAQVIVIGLGLLKMETTGIGGWCNLSRDSQRNGRYFIMVLKNTYRMAFQTVTYQDEPLKISMELKKR